MYATIAAISALSRDNSRPFMLRVMQPLIRSTRSRTPPSRPENRG